MQQKTDEELMCLYQKGEALAFDELMLRYKQALFRFAYRLCQNAAEADDIAQEVFCRVHQSRGRYSPSGKFSTWLFTIAHNLFVSNLRRASWLVLWPRRSDDPEELVEMQSPASSPAELTEQSDLSETVRLCIQGLPFLQREALVLREYEGMEYEEIARIMKKSLGTVKTLIHRARMNLKERLLPYMKEVEGGYHG